MHALLLRSSMERGKRGAPSLGTGSFKSRQGVFYHSLKSPAAYLFSNILVVF